MRIGLALSSAGRVLMWRAIDDGLTTLGSNPECDLCIADPDVAPIQAVLRRDGSALTLLNRHPGGTKVGDELIERDLRLGDGEEIHLGPIVATVRFVADAGGTADAARRVRTRTLVREHAPSGRFVLIAPEALPGRRFALDAPLGIGTDPGNDVVLEDPYVSGFHARLALEEGRVVVRDLQSRNGVFIGDRKVREGEVAPGMQLRLGRTVFMVASEAAASEAEPSLAFETRPLVGESSVMDAVRERIRRVAQSHAPVLVTGETGTGKEVAARLIAALSPRAAAPFLALNCGALGRSLIESELFGHEKGAFTGAVARKVGAFEAASGGTLFLDEIGELPLELQPQLLRVLESGEVRRVGAVESFHADVRLVAATNRQLPSEVARGTFREDLYHRLHVLVIELPSLRQRREDIPELARYFLAELAPEGASLSLSADAVARLVAHEWPGNVRELRNVVQRAVLMRQGDVLGPDDITFAASTLVSRVQTASATRQRTLAELEREAIVAELVRHGGSKTEAAVALGLSRSTIHRKIEQYGLDVDALVAQR